jgi:hypothetical protein
LSRFGNRSWFNASKFTPDSATNFELLNGRAFTIAKLHFAPDFRPGRAMSPHGWSALDEKYFS